MQELDLQLNRPVLLSTQFWALQTLNNPTEATSQFGYLEIRVSRHQSSSPGTVYNALNQISKYMKGTYALESKELAEQMRHLAGAERLRKPAYGEEGLLLRRKP